MKININEIYTSIDGEINGWGQGRLTTFIRMAGCNLSCSYCDSKQTWNPDNGILMDIEKVVRKVENIGLKNITITGGEPLLQRAELKQLISLLYESNDDYFINVETNGSFELDYYFWYDKYNICYTIDYKQGIGNYKFMVDVGSLSYNDTIKFIIVNRKQYDEAVKIVDRFNFMRNCVCKFAFSPIHNILILDPRELMNWMIKDKLDNVLLNCQLHKYLKVG